MKFNALQVATSTAKKVPKSQMAKSVFVKCYEVLNEDVFTIYNIDKIFYV